MKKIMTVLAALSFFAAASCSCNKAPSCCGTGGSCCKGAATTHDHGK